MFLTLYKHLNDAIASAGRSLGERMRRHPRISASLYLLGAIVLAVGLTKCSNISLS